MKLCYIWIEEYKGFSSQGFNLSSEFIFDFSLSDSTLRKSVNEKYINNFFGPAIIDIKGIIGKNASGKTNILELIQYISEGANTIINKPFFAVIQNENTFIIYSYKISDINSDFEVDLRSYEGGIPGINSIYFSNIYDGRRHNFNKKIIDVSTNDLLNSQHKESINKNYQKMIQNQIKFIQSPKFNLLEKLEQSINPNESNGIKPLRVILTAPNWFAINFRIKQFEENYQKETRSEFSFRDFVRSFRRKITDNKSANSIKYFSAFLVFIDFVLNRDILSYPETKNYNKEAFHNNLISLFMPIQNDFRIDEFYNYFITDFANRVGTYWDYPEISKFLSNIDQYNFETKSGPGFREDIGTYSNRRIQFTLDFDEKVGSFIKSYLDATTNQSISYSVEWDGISSGHKAYLNLFSIFYSIAARIKSDDVLISIDEGDLYFHPKWQTEFLFKLINILPKLLNKKCQFFLTTHSPFLVSDLPKNNLLFVQKRIDGILTVIPNEQIEGETFGGNIGELYIDAFFMQGNLISQFAASKIQALIYKIRDHKNQISNEDRILISEIGDELIRTQLGKLLNDKN